MINSEYERSRHDLKEGDFVVMQVRGNYGDYEVQGYVKKIEKGRIYLRKGISHHYKRIRSMTRCTSEETKA